MQGEGGGHQRRNLGDDGRFQVGDGRTQTASGELRSPRPREGLRGSGAERRPRLLTARRPYCAPVQSGQAVASGKRHPLQTGSRARLARAPRLLFVVNVDWYLISHRMPLARAAKSAGWEVWVAAKDTGRVAELERQGLRVVPLRMTRTNAGVIHELVAAIQLLLVVLRVRPRILHNVSLKAVLYGSIIGRTLRIPLVINAVNGMGLLFGQNPELRRLRSVVTSALSWGLKSNRSVVIVQNNADLECILSETGVERDQCILIRGSGVDTDEFAFSPSNDGNSDQVVMLPSRLLWSKGVDEFVEVARRARAERWPARFVLVGLAEDDNPDAVTLDAIRGWEDEGIVEWWGRRRDMPDVLAQASIVVLPTWYREGVPKVLLEAASCGRPIVTTDMPGCNDVVVHGENGYLVAPHDVGGLFDAIAALLGDADLRQKMGVAGRSRVLDHFTEELVVLETMKLYDSALRDR